MVQSTCELSFYVVADGGCKISEGQFHRFRKSKVRDPVGLCGAAEDVPQKNVTAVRVCPEEASASRKTSCCVMRDPTTYAELF